MPTYKGSGVIKRGGFVICMDMVTAEAAAVMVVTDMDMATAAHLR
ncbi:putative antitoxin [Bacillus subtilis]